MSSFRMCKRSKVKWRVVFKVKVDVGMCDIRMNISDFLCVQMNDFPSQKVMSAFYECLSKRVKFQTHFNHNIELIAATKQSIFRTMCVCVCIGEYGKNHLGNQNKCKVTAWTCNILSPFLYGSNVPETENVKTCHSLFNLANDLSYMFHIHF